MKQRYLIDTQALLWIRAEAPQLPGRAKRAFRSEGNEIFLSIASVWEMAIKTSLGKLRIDGTLDDFVHTAVRDLGLALLAVKLDHVLETGKLPFHHRDPFDRLLIAQALVEDLTVLGNDDRFDAYGVRRLWS